MTVNIKGVNIETDNLSVKSIEDIKRSGIFDHLTDNGNACKELWEKIKPVKPDPTADKLN